MSDPPIPRWKSEVSRSETPEPGAAPKIDVGAIDIGSANTSGGDSVKPGAVKLAHVKKPVPKLPIVIGIVGGAILGSILAYAVLSFIWWRREVNEAARFDAQVEADRETERRKKASEQADPMLRYSLEQGRK